MNYEIEMVKLIQKNYENKKTVETDFILAHNLYARAEIPPTDRVRLISNCFYVMHFN